MKGRNKRPIPDEAQFARIVQDTRDSTLDRFIPIEEAEALSKRGKLKQIDMGPHYPNSYMLLD